MLYIPVNSQVIHDNQVDILALHNLLEEIEIRETLKHRIGELRVFVLTSDCPILINQKLILFFTDFTNLFKFGEAQSNLPNVLPFLLFLLPMKKVEPLSFALQKTTRNYSVQMFPSTEI